MRFTPSLELQSSCHCCRWVERTCIHSIQINLVTVIFICFSCCLTIFLCIKLCHLRLEVSFVHVSNVLLIFIYFSILQSFEMHSLLIVGSIFSISQTVIKSTYASISFSIYFFYYFSSICCCSHSFYFY